MSSGDDPALRSAAVFAPDRLRAVEAARVRASGWLAGLDQLVMLASQWTGAPIARVSLVDARHEIALASVGHAGLTANPRFPIADALGRLVVERGAEVTFADLGDPAAPPTAPGAVAAGIKGFAGVPLRLDGQVVGALCVMDERARAWTAEELAALQRLGLVAESGITSAAGADADALGPVVGAMRLDARLEVVVLSGDPGPAPRELLVGRRLPDVVPPDVWAEHRRHFELGLLGVPSTFRMRWPGAPCDWSIQIQPLQGGADGPGLVATRRDYVDRGQEPQDGVVPVQAPRPARPPIPDDPAARLLFDSALFAMVDEGVLVYDAEGTLLAINPAGRRMLAIPAGDVRDAAQVMSGTVVRDEDGAVVAPGDRAQDVVLRTGSPVLGQHVTVDGPLGEVVVRVNAVPLLTADGERRGAVVSLLDVTAQREVEQRARELAERDALTGLYNRRHLMRRLEEALVVTAAERSTAALVAVDLDGFKAINDAFGHLHGDAVLRVIAARLLAHAPPDGVVARVGGDEFAVLLPAGTDAAAAAAVADGLVAAVGEPVAVGATEHRCPCSIGVALTADGATPEGVLGDADLAMYRAKAAGGARARRFSPDMRAAAEHRERIARELAAAIEQDDLRLHYQPIFARDGRLAAFEALVRWAHPSRGLLAPAAFVPIAERSPLIVALGDWVLAEACRQLAAWRDERGAGVLLPVQVNVAAAQLGDAALVGRVGALLDRHGLDPRLLAIEVTETMITDGGDAVDATLAGLRDTGVAVSLDDFGTGYSSLHHLLDLRIDALKIDRTFVSGSESGRRHRQLIAAICDMAKRLDIAVVAEGVETEAQRAMLAELGCDRLQGFLLGRPQPPAEAGERLRRG